MAKKVWFITGCSTGLGRELAHQVLKSGDIAGLTARRPEQVQDLARPYGDNPFVVALDVTDDTMRKRAVAEAEMRFGRIDVLANNAGYSYFFRNRSGRRR